MYLVCDNCNCIFEKDAILASELDHPLCDECKVCIRKETYCTCDRCTKLRNRRDAIHLTLQMLDERELLTLHIDSKLHMELLDIDLDLA